MKNLFVPCLLMITNLLFAQTHIEIGGSTRPSVYLSPTTYSDQYSIMPALDISIGDDYTKAVLSLGNYSRIGAQIVTQWFYTTASYNLSLLNTEDTPKHGAALEMGFNYKIITDCSYHRLQIGTSLAVMGKFNTGYPEIVLFPICVTFTSGIFKPKLKRTKYLASK